MRRRSRGSYALEFALTGAAVAPMGAYRASIRSSTSDAGDERGAQALVQAADPAGLGSGLASNTQRSPTNLSPRSRHRVAAR